MNEVQGFEISAVWLVLMYVLSREILNNAEIRHTETPPFCI